MTEGVFIGTGFHFPGVQEHLWSGVGGFCAAAGAP